MRKLLQASAALILGCAALSACGGGSGGNNDDARTLTLGVLGEPLSFDPSQANVGHALPWYQAVYDTLILREPDGTLSPMLATKWSYNKDRTVLTMDLRDDVAFSDGEAFDAEAVVANLENMQQGNGPQASQLSVLDTAEAVDSDTVEIRLTAPNPAFEYYLSQAAGLMASPAAIGSKSIARTPIGSGPYELSAPETTAGSQYVFTAREGYWNADLQKFDRIVLRPMEDITARLNGLVSGQLDGALLDARSAAQAKDADLVLTPNQVNWEGLLLMDRDGKLSPALADVRVRQAINYALDRKTMLREINLGEGTATSQVFGPNSDAFDEELDSFYPYDPDRARDLLSKAGYADGFSLKVPTTTGFETVMAVLKQQLGDVGITVKQVPVPFENFQTDLGAGKFPAAYFRLFQGDTWVAVQQIISTTALYNPFDSQDPELDDLISQVQTSTAEGSPASPDVNRFVTEEAWFAPFYRTTEQYFTTSGIDVEAQVQQVVPSIYNYAPAS